MKLIKELKEKYTIIFLVLFTVVFIRLDDIPLRYMYEKVFSYPNCIFLEGITLQIILFAICYYFIKKCDDIAFIGLKFENKVKDLWVIWPFIIFIIINSLDGIKMVKDINTNFISVVLYILMLLSTGFFEEILVRGVVLKLLLNKYGKNKKGIYLSVIISSFIFGFAHLNGYIIGQADLMHTLSTIITATFVGVLSAAVFLRTKSLWVTIIIHALLDVVGAGRYLKINSSEDMIRILKDTPMTLENLLLNILVTLLLLLCGLFFIKNVRYSRSIES